jgi:hypothetical protein
MILRQKPPRPELYYAVDEQKHLEWASQGFLPIYLWQGKFYYRITAELNEMIGKGGEEN